MNQRKHRLLNELLILFVFIVVIYSIITAFCPVKNVDYVRQSFKYENKMKMKTNDVKQVGYKVK